MTGNPVELPKFCFKTGTIQDSSVMASMHTLCQRERERERETKT